MESFDIGEQAWLPFELEGLWPLLDLDMAMLGRVSQI